MSTGNLEKSYSSKTLKVRSFPSTTALTYILPLLLSSGFLFTNHSVLDSLTMASTMADDLLVADLVLNICCEYLPIHKALQISILYFLTTTLCLPSRLAACLPRGCTITCVTHYENIYLVPLGRRMKSTMWYGAVGFIKPSFQGGIQQSTIRFVF